MLVLTMFYKRFFIMCRYNHCQTIFGKFDNAIVQYFTHDFTIIQE